MNLRPSLLVAFTCLSLTYSAGGQTRGQIRDLAAECNGGEDVACDRIWAIVAGSDNYDFVLDLTNDRFLTKIALDHPSEKVAEAAAVQVTDQDRLFEIAEKARFTSAR